MDSVISSSPPLLAHAGDQWTDSYGRQFIYTVNADGTHGQWVQMPLQRSGPPAPTVTDAPVVINPTPKITSSHQAPLAPNPNDLWFDTLTGFLFIWYWDGNTYQWVVTNPGRGSDVPPPASVIPIALTPDPGVTMIPNPITSVGKVGVDTVWFDARVASEIPANLPPSGAAGGALSGTYPNPGLAVPYPTTLPPNGPAGGDLAGSYPNPTIKAGVIPTPPVIPTTLPPSGPAGGALAGTYPNPGLAVPYPTTLPGPPTGPAGGALSGTYPSPGLAVPYPTTLPPSGAAGGDLAGSYPAPTLADIVTAAGPIGDATHTPVITIDAKGRVTTLSSAAISGGGSGGGASVTISDTAPSSPAPGNLWWESDSGKLLIYYTDANSSQWVEANSSAGPPGQWTQLTQAAYDALSPPNPTTLYVVVG